MGLVEGEEGKSVNPLDELRVLVNGYGEIEEEYGGYAIKVVDGYRFPWSKICSLLVGLNHEVWIERRGEHLYVVSKPLAD